MINLNKTKSILQRWKRDESGTAALSWALSLTVIIGAVGAAMDFAMLSDADARAQTIADTTALAAAIYVKNNETIPTDPDKGLIGPYNAADLGYDFKKWVISEGEKAPKVNVSYDNVAREATVTVEGYTRPVLVQILTKKNELAFKATSVVKYYEKDIQDPASIVMVLDNSGSMAFDDLPIDPVTRLSPAGATRRMDGLQSAAIKFMDIMETAVGPQPQDGSVDLVLRTGMMAFDSAIVRTSPMRWGYTPDSEFTSMTPLLATNSAPPLEVANTWLNVTEPAIHNANLPGKTPLKYLILMTDGKNTVGLDVWVARAGTQNWRAWVQVGTRTEYREETETTTQTVSEIVNSYRANANCRIENGYPRRSYWYNGRRYFTSQRVLCDREEEVTTTIQVPYEVPEYDWEYREQEEEPTEPGDWEEGEFDIESNIQTRQQCDALHAQGVEVFTVGFALVAGQFETNEWGSRPGGSPIYPRDQDYTPQKGEADVNKARAILQYCANKPENFITANDTASLEAAFDRIGNTIIKEIIRISS